MEWVECDVEPGSPIATVLELDLRISESIRSLEGGDRRAAAALMDSLYAPEFTLNGPANKIQTREETTELAAESSITFTTYERYIEAAYTAGSSVVVLMGRELVVMEGVRADLDGRRVHRRFTDAWRFVDGEWKEFLRQSTVTRVE